MGSHHAIGDSGSSNRSAHPLMAVAGDVPTSEPLGVRAVRGSLWLGLVNLASKGSQVLVMLALARFLGAAELGLVTVTISVMSLGQVLQIMGVFDVVARARSQPVEFAGTVASISVGISLVIMLVGELAATALAEAIGASNAAGLMRAAFFGLPFIAYGGVQLALLHRQLDFRRRLIPDAGSALLGGATTIAMAASGAGSRSAVVGVLVTAISMPLLGLAVGVVIPLRWDSAAALIMWHWMRVVGPGAVLGLVLLNVDYLVVTKVLGPGPTGSYSLAYRIAFVPYILVAVTLAGVAFPVYSRQHRTGDVDGLRRSVVGFSSAVAATVGLLYTIIFVLSDEVSLLGAHWASSAAPLRVLCLYGWSLSLAFTAQATVRAAGRTGWYLASQVLHFVMLVPLLVIMTRWHGIVGTAWAQVAAAAVLLSAAAIMAVRSTGLDRGIAMRALRAPLMATATALAVGLVWRTSGISLNWPTVMRVVSLGGSVVAVFFLTLVAADHRGVRHTLALVGGRQRT
jgi:O-antigen/teichoic acid export membrane protein